VSAQIRRLSIEWNAIGTAAEVARSLEQLARKVLEEGVDVDLKATLRCPKEKARKV
jgi:hypothetical protein